MPEEGAAQQVATPQAPSQGGVPERQAQVGERFSTAAPQGLPMAAPLGPPRSEPAPQEVVPAPAEPEMTPEKIQEIIRARPEVLEGLLSGMKHEDLAKVPAYNAQLQRQQARLREEEGKKVQEQYRQRLQVQQQATQWRAYLGQLEKNGQLLQAQLTNPQVAQWVEVIRKLDTGELDNLATSAADSLRQAVSQDDEFKDVDWDKLEKEVDPKKPTSLFMGILKQSDERRRKELEKTLPDLVKEAVEQEIARREGRSDQPSTGNNPGQRQVTDEGRFTPQQVRDMPDDEYEKRRLEIFKSMKPR